MLGAMVDSCYKNTKPSLSKEEVRDQAVTFLIAGYTTTASALGGTIYELLKHPIHYKNVRHESNAAWAKETTDETLKSISYTRSVFNEALRLYPTAPWVARGTKHEIILNGIRIPPETPIIMTPYLVHRDSKIFDDPATFKPECFQEAKKPEPMEYIPFSVGGHQCIGRKVTLMEGPIILSKIFANGQVKRVADTPNKVEINTAVNVEPDRPIPISFTGA